MLNSQNLKLYTAMAAIIQWNSEKEYQNEILEYLLDREREVLPDVDFISRQPGFDWKMRSGMVQHLVGLRNLLGLDEDILHLCVHIFDRIMSLMHVPVNKLTLLSTVSLAIALKYEKGANEYSVEDVTNLLGFDLSENVLAAERLVLTKLDYKLGRPSPVYFAERLFEVDDDESEIRILAHYFMEVMLTDEHFLTSVPSLVAAVAYWLSRRILGIWAFVSASCLDDLVLISWPAKKALFHRWLYFRTN